MGSVICRGQSFPWYHRVKKREEFLLVQTTGRRSRTEHLSVHVLDFEANDPRKLSRVGFTITTKVDKRSARRNRLRRRMRELFRKEFLKQIIRKDVVVIALNGATELSFAELSEELYTLLLRARLVRRMTRRV